MMKIRMVFDDWRNSKGKSVYGTEHELSYGDFHSGTIFEGEIDIDAESEEELKEAMEKGFVPVFYLIGLEEKT